MDEILRIPVLPEKNTKAVIQNYDIAFQDVSFSYETDSQVNALAHVSFLSPHGKVTAVVGPSGGGKSTIANLISRFYDVTDGSIQIGGVDIREMCIRDSGKTADRKPELETCVKRQKGGLVMQKLGVLEDTLFIPMLGRIYASEHCPQILYDKKALELKKKLPSGLIEQNMQNQYTLLASASRSANMDRIIRSFLERRPDGVIVQLGCGLETTYHRCDNGKAHWYACLLYTSRCV